MTRLYWHFIKTQNSSAIEVISLKLQLIRISNNAEKTLPRTFFVKLCRETLIAAKVTFSAILVFSRQNIGFQTELPRKSLLLVISPWTTC